MSEFTNTQTGRGNFRWRMLTSVSALALLSTVHVREACASDDDAPPVWIELGGTLEHVSASQTPYIPPFAAHPLPTFVSISPIGLEKPPGYSIGGEGAVSFHPDETSWTFLAAIQYGRAIKHKDVNQHLPFSISGYTSAVPFFNTKTSGMESHAILDFQAGKDIGLGSAGSGTISLGMRFAQFGARSDTFLNYHSISGIAHSARSFHGVGPSIAWTELLPVIGHENSGELSLDWGANAAFLFGRQKADIHQQTTANRYPWYHRSAPYTRARSVTVPNVGGFAGVSYRLENVKLKLGYRADFFFGAMDGGFDTARRVDRGF